MKFMDIIHAMRNSIVEVASLSERLRQQSGTLAQPLRFLLVKPVQTAEQIAPEEARLRSPPQDSRGSAPDTAPLKARWPLLKN
jgi:hypothetical protein